MPRPPKQKPADRAAATKRLQWVLENTFGGNKSAMAAAVGVSHTAINRAVSGELAPSRRLLESIAGVHPLSRVWVLSGQGPEVLAAAESQLTGSFAVPLVSELFAGHPSANQAQCTGDTFAVASDVFADTRYAYAIRSTDPISSASEGIRRGDLVLIETSPAAWSTDVDIDSRLCVVRASGKQSKITLARATIDEMGEIEADFFSYRESRDEEQEQEFLLRVRPGQLPKLSWKKRPRGHEQVWHHPITRADVVGIAVALIRRNP